MMRLPNIVVRAALFCIFLLFSCAVQQPPPLHPVVPAEKKTLVDPRIVHGELSNGFQYILQKNTTPKDRVNIHLNVFAGAMHETDEQQGLAHFLEHMLFNGSEHFKPGELARYFPSIGMDFGADANAHTTFFNTVYDLALPTGDKKQMDEGFLIIQDYAKGALLLGSEIERERGIILAEKRERDSVSYRTFKKTLEFELPDSRFISRFPIGIEEVIKEAGWTLLKDYYDTWYRPENMVLIVVGDFDIEQVQQMLIQRFSKLRARSPLPDQNLKTRWEPHEGIKAFYHHEPEAASTDVTIQTITWEPFLPMTVERLKEETLIYITNLMLYNRLSRMISKQTADFSDASVFAGRFLQNVGMSAISATCPPEKWQKALEQIDSVLRQGLQYGFRPDELERVRADYIAVLEQASDQAETRKTPKIAKRILATINRKGLLLSPEKRAELLIPYIKTLTVEDAVETLKNVWSKDHRLLLVTGNARIASSNAEKIISETYKKSQAVAVQPYKGIESISFPYIDPPGDAVDIKTREDNKNSLDISVLEFSNQVRLNVKRTDFKEKELLFRVSFGSGKASEPTSKSGLYILAGEVIESSGFGQMDADQLSYALAGKKISFSFDIRDNSFVIKGSADPSELQLVFEFIQHMINDPGFRPETLDLAKIKYRQKYESMLRTAQGAMHITGSLFLADDNPRFGLPHPDLIDSYTLDDIKSWVLPQFKKAPLEISVIGDIDTEEVISWAQKYAGGFGLRQAYPVAAVNKDNIRFPFGKKLDISLDTKIEAGAVHVAFMTDDFWDIPQTRRLSVLARVIEERLRFIIREELGEAYAPYVYNNPSTVFDSYGVLHVSVSVGPGRHELVYQKIDEIINSIVTKGIKPEEAGLALKPLLTHLKTLRNTNNYWLNAVLANSSQFPQKFEWAANMFEDYAAIGEKDLNNLAQKFLKKDKSANIFIRVKSDLD